MMSRGRGLRGASVLTAGFAVLCAVPTARAAAQEDVPPVIEKFKAKDPGMGKIFADAVGYVVFPTVGKAGIGLGGARGKGWVYEGGHIIGKSTLTQVSFGFQFGGQAYSEIVFFQTPQALENFKQGPSSSTRRHRRWHSPHGLRQTWLIGTGWRS